MTADERDVQSCADHGCDCGCYDYRVLRAERDRYREAILEHRATWHRSNGTNYRNALPADLTLWMVVLDPERRNQASS